MDSSKIRIATINAKGLNNISNACHSLDGSMTIALI